MVWTLVVVYVGMVIVATLVVFGISAHLGEERQPALQRLGLSAAAGLVWPVVLLGVVELSSFAVYAKVHEHDDDGERVDVMV